MSYVFTKKVPISFEQAVEKVSEGLSREGFGILTEIDVKATLKKKLSADFRKYRILGACNPPYAYEALQVEPHIGAMLPCNVVVQEYDNGEVEIAAIDPLASMRAIQNDALQAIAKEIQLKLKKVIEEL